jgi:hypothetical protein
MPVQNIHSVRAFQYNIFVWYGFPVKHIQSVRIFQYQIFSQDDAVRKK